MEHSPQEAAVGRLRAWTEADAEAERFGAEMGERLVISATDNIAGPWFPDADELIRIAGERLPQARLERIADGLVSRPDETAGAGARDRRQAAPSRCGHLLRISPCPTSTAMTESPSTGSRRARRDRWSSSPATGRCIPRSTTRSPPSSRGDHRVVRYDDRHAGDSTHVGPYDLDTAAADMAAVIEAAGAPAIVVAQADGTNRAVRALAERPELITAIVANGGIPIGRRHFQGFEALITSEGVVEALMSQVETDYRGAIRGILSATNAQMSEEELRERVEKQIEYSPGAAAAERIRAWANDDPLELGRAAGDRLWLLYSEGAGGGWFPTGPEAQKRIEEMLPDAHHVEVDDGMVSRPDQTAEVVRRVSG